MLYYAEWTHTKRQLLSRKVIIIIIICMDRRAEKENGSTGRKSFPPLHQSHTANPWQS